MAFCMYCGKKLEDGEVCNCNEAQAVEENIVDVQPEDVTVIPSMEEEQTNQGMSFEQVQQGYQDTPVQQEYPQQVQPQQMYQQDMQSQPMYQQNPQQDMQSQPMYQQSFQQQGYQQNPQMQQGYQQNSQQFNEMKEKSSMYLKELLNSWICILKQPVSLGRQFVTNGSHGIAIGLIVIQAILTAIFGCILAGKFNGAIKSAVASTVGSYVSELGSYASELNKYLCSLPTVFIISIVVSLISSFALAGLLLAGMKICKGQNTNYRNMLCAVGVRAVGISILQVVTLLMCLFSIVWAIIFFVVADVVGLLFLVPVVSAGSGMDENKLGYMIFVVLIAFSLVTGILAKVAGPMYIPSEYKQHMDEIEGSLDELMDGLDELEALLN